MPFLDRLQRWADDRPDETAVVVAGEHLSWSGLRDKAAALVPSAPAVTVLSEQNSTHFAVAFAAAVAGERQCAVLDPAWPQQLQDGITARIAGSETRPARAVPGPGTGLADGPPETSFLVGLTSGTTSVPKAFTRSRRSWQESFEASIEFFGLTQDDKSLAPGPLAASLNLYALAECLYAGAEFHTLDHFDVGAAHAAVSHDGITRLVLVPTMLRLLSERGLSRRCRCLRHPQHHLRRFQAGRPDPGGGPALGTQRDHLRVLRRLGAQLRLRRRACARASQPEPARHRHRKALSRRRNPHPRRRRRRAPGRR